MFTTSTGALTLEEPAVVIAPSLTRDQFLGSPLADGAATHVANEPYHSWKLKGTYRSAGLDLLLVLWFRDQQLTMVSLMDRDPRFGTSWDDHSVENEMARQKSHDAWLSRALGPNREFSWGSVWSGYDERGGFSDIVVKYAAAGS
jgi:hypothetical protein